MKKIVIFALLIVILAVGGTYYYFTRQFEQHLEGFATQVAMFGQLDWQNVRIHPGGSARINQLRFAPHGLDSEIRIDRIAFRAPNLFALLQSSTELNAGRLPEALGFSIQALRIPLDDIDPANLESGFSGGLPFEAAGCGARKSFSAHDLAHMDYWDLVVDLDLNYEIGGNGESMILRASTQTRNVSGLSVSARFFLGSGSRDIDLLMRAWAMARLSQLDITYRNLGFRERMIDLCVNETGMEKTAYLDHHHAHWVATWHEYGLVPDPDLQQAYRAFLERPEELYISASPENGLPISAFTRLTREELMPQLNLAIGINRRPDTEIGFETVEAVAIDPAETAPASDNDDEAEEAPQPRSRWSDIPVNEAARHLDSRIIITTSGGDTVRGHLMDVDPENLHIRVRAVGGYLVRPFPIDRIENIRVRN